MLDRPKDGLTKLEQLKATASSVRKNLEGLERGIVQTEWDNEKTRKAEYDKATDKRQFTGSHLYKEVDGQKVLVAADDLDTSKKVAVKENEYFRLDDDSLVLVNRIVYMSKDGKHLRAYAKSEDLK